MGMIPFFVGDIIDFFHRASKDTFCKLCLQS
jgi:hypothetical protein